MVGGALVRALEARRGQGSNCGTNNGACEEGCEILTAPREHLDLREQVAVRDFMAQEKPDAIFLAAAHVGGIMANREEPADFLYNNLMIAGNVIAAAHEQGVQKLLFLGSSCIYPREAQQPICEDALLTGPLEETNEAYAIAKIAGLKLCAAYRKQYGRDYISAMPCNLYGAGDYYDQERAHVIPALIMKLHAAKQDGAPFVTLWGTGTPLREFLYVDDLAQALLSVMQDYSGIEPINIGSGEEINIAALAVKIAAIVGYNGEIRFDPEKPDGTTRKIMDNSKISALGWRASTSLDDGLAQAYQDYLQRYDEQHSFSGTERKKTV